MDTIVQRNIVVSAVNLRKGGTLTVLRDCLSYLSARQDLHITALVHKRELCDHTGIDYIEIPWSTKSWFHRLWCEYVTMNRISKQLQDTDLWLSLHDTTPRVRAKRQAVYCHTLFPFMRPRLHDWCMDYKIPMFSLFTRFAYRWNVKSNRFLIVQQEWMRDAMARLVGFDASSIIVAPPAFKPVAIPERDSRSEPGMTKKEPGMPPKKPGMTTFLYPSTADAHKDFETLCEATRLLEGRIGEGRFRVVITVKGDENRYARWLKRRWSDVKSLDFRGFLSREGLALEYGSASCLVFPSRAESWGLPISEFLPTGKPMILADLPYAHETAAGAKEVAFFPVSDAGALADLMQAAAEGRNDIFRSVPQPDIKPPYARSWEALFNLLLS